MMTIQTLKNKIARYLLRAVPADGHSWHDLQQPVSAEEIAAGGGERQAAASIDNIREDHRGRYAFALRFIPAGARVLDAACGVGYGSYMLATRCNDIEVTALDRSAAAIAFAQKHYSAPNITYLVADCLDAAFNGQLFDAVVSFETIEHIEHDRQFLLLLARLLKPGGLLLCSTPNQEQVPFSKTTHPFHCRHYTPQEFEDILVSSGFAIMHKWSQHSQNSVEVLAGWHGLYNIAVCKKSADGFCRERVTR